VRDVLPILTRDDFHQLLFYFSRCRSIREAQTVSDSEDVRIDRDSALAERGRKNDVGGLAAYAGQFEQLVHRLRDAPPKTLEQYTARIFDVLGLHAKEAATFDQVFQPPLRRLGQRLRSWKSLEKNRCRQIDSSIRALRRQNHRDEQLKDVLMVQSGRRMRIRSGETPKQKGCPPGRFYGSLTRW
jgi:hypothetical protein